MNKEKVYTSLWKIFVAVAVFLFFYLFSASDHQNSHALACALVAVMALGLSELVGCVFALIYQGYKYISSRMSA